MNKNYDSKHNKIISSQTQQLKIVLIQKYKYQISEIKTFVKINLNGFKIVKEKILTLSN